MTHVRNPAALAAVVDSAVLKALTLKAIAVENRAKTIATGFVDTGKLRGSITFSISGAGLGSIARIGSNVQYALWVEKGTGIYGPHATPIVPRTKPFLVFPSAKYGRKSGKFKGRVVVRSVRGRRATPYLEPALGAPAGF